MERLVESLKGVGKARKEQYEKLKIFSVKDLIFHFPKRYEDCTRAKSLKYVEDGGKAVVVAQVLEKRAINFSKRKNIFKILAKDEENTKLEITYFNNIYIYNSLKVGKKYIFYGRVNRYGLLFRMANPLILKNFGVIAKYSLTKGLGENILKNNIKQAVSLVKKDYNSLPKSLEKKYNLIDFKTAVILIHFPQNVMQYKIARRRLVFEELLYWQIGLLKLKTNKQKTLNFLKTANMEPFLKELPFSLTESQKNVVLECVADCKRTTPMNRLVQGDVGSGKTIVAVVLAYLFATENMGVALMAPTDILARQHYKTFSSFLEKFKIKVGLFVGGLKEKEKKIILERIKNGEIDVVIGTHSLFYDRVVFKNLSLIITDDHHRFGVKQREKFLNKGDAAHVLVMSATPIPRTLALIFYGDLDISTITELPPGRILVKTFFVNSKQRLKVLKFVAEHIKKKHQAYFVCPAVEKGQLLVENVFDYAKMLEGVFSKHCIGIIHGKMEAKEKNSVMEKFLKGEIDVLVATTVIEVGVDVSNASVIVIENAEMFGLAQLHQLRGRVGRSNLESFCFLISNNMSKENVSRMRALCETNDGFEVAKKDFSLRGPGDLFGQEQHGKMNFKIANLKRDFNCAKVCRKEAEQILLKDYELNSSENKNIKRNVNEFFSQDVNVL